MSRSPRSEGQEALTDRPFGFNIYAFLPQVDAICDMIIEEQVPVVEIGTLPGLFEPLAGQVARLKAGGVAVIGKAASVDEAVAYERAGVDFIAIKGADGGGHIFGFTGTFSLLPQVVDAVRVPVINGGGVADGRGVAASFMLGAEAVEVGSRFLLAHECPVHENYKQAVRTPRKERQYSRAWSAVTRSGSCQTVCRTGFKVEKECTVEEAIRNIQEMAADSLRKAAVDGDIAEGCVTVGQVTGMLRKTQSAREIIDEIVTEYTALLGAAPDFPS